MIVVFSGVLTGEMIVMSVDSAVTEEHPDHKKNVTGNKAYPFPGVGCVTTWGERSGNEIGNFLTTHRVSAATYQIEQLGDLVEEFLTKKYRPADYGLREVGYHVAGFGQAGMARLFHKFYAFDRPRNPEQRKPQ